MQNGWTGGQYSLYRAILGIYLFVHFVTLAPWSSELFSKQGVLPADASPLLRLFPNILAWSDSPVMAGGLITMGAIASLFLTVGAYDRPAAIACWYVLACVFGRNPLISNPSLPFVGWLLLAHLLVPASPYGSWSGRKSTATPNGWFMPAPLFAAAWIVMSLAYSYSGYEKLNSPSWVNGTALAKVLTNPLARVTPLHDALLVMPAFGLRIATWGALFLELSYAPLALFRMLRPWLWIAMVMMHIGLLTTINFTELSFGMLILHLFTFDLAWVRGQWPRRQDLLFYDGNCGLCHRWTRFVLSEDRSGAAFLFAPMQGKTFAAAEPVTVQRGDTIIVQTAEDEILDRSNAVLYVLMRLGGLWRIIAYGGRLMPRMLRDAVYNLVARYRRSFFSEPQELCPMLPKELRMRFRE